MVLAHIRKQAFTAVIRQTGLRGLYFGFSSTLYRDISFNMVFFTSRELFVKYYKRRYSVVDPDAWTRVLLGFPAGTVASIVACPFDVVKTRQQGMELGKSAHLLGPLVDILCATSSYSICRWKGAFLFSHHVGHRSQRGSAPLDEGLAPSAHCCAKHDVCILCHQ